MLMFLKVDEACTAMLGILYFVRSLLNLVYIIVPIGLIVMVMLDFSKGVISINDGSKTWKFILNRAIYTIIILILPSTLFSVMSAIGLSSKDSESCWKYVGDQNVEIVQELLKQQEEALKKKNTKTQSLLNQLANARYSAIAELANRKKAFIANNGSSGSNSTVGGSKSCKTKQKIRLTSFSDQSLRNSINQNNVGVTNGSWKTYTYNGKTYLVLASAMNNTSWSNPKSSFNFKDYDVLTLEIEGKKYDAIVLDVCGACANSTDVLKLDLWVNNSSQPWGDYQYLCTS